MVSFLTEPGQSVANLLAYLKYVSHFPDFPKNFVPPELLNPKYVPPRSGQFIIPLCASTFGFASLFVFARLGARLRSKAFGLDDWLMIVAWICSFGFTMIQIMLVLKGGVGHHLYDLDYRTIQRALQLEHWNFVVYVFSIQTIRYSVVFFIRRLTPFTATTMRKIIDGTLVFQTIYAIAVLLFAFLSCSPPRAIWSADERLKNFNCLDQSTMIMSLSIIWSILDFWTLALPIPMVWKLKLPRRSRIGMIVLFLIGLTASACSIGRIFYIKGAFGSWDPTWNGIGIIVWDQLEIVLGLIAACLPALNVFLVRIIPSKLKAGGKSYRHGYSKSSDYSHLKKWKRRKGDDKDAESVEHSDMSLLSPIQRPDTAYSGGRHTVGGVGGIEGSPLSKYHFKDLNAEKDDGPDYITGGAFFADEDAEDSKPSWGHSSLHTRNYSNSNTQSPRPGSLMSFSRPRVTRETAARAWSMRGAAPPASIDPSFKGSIRAATVGGRSLHELEQENEENGKSGRDSFALPPLPPLPPHPLASSNNKPPSVIERRVEIRKLPTAARNDNGDESNGNDNGNNTGENGVRSRRGTNSEEEVFPLPAGDVSVFSEDTVWILQNPE